MRVIRILLAIAVSMVAMSAFASQAVAASPKVATVSIFSDDSTLAEASSYLDFGHSWLVVKNISSDTIRVGKIDGIAPGESITVGTWGNQDDTGVWYNLEAFYIHKDPTVFHDASLSRDITMDDLTKLSKYIVEHDSYSVTNNCSNFAANAWNAILPWYSPLRVFPGAPIPTPAVLRFDISLHTNAEYGQSVHIPWSGRGVWYADGKKQPLPSTKHVFEAANPTPDIIGTGVSLVNDSVAGNADQWGHLDGFTQSSKTWVLSTGHIADAVGDPSALASTDLGGGGNTTLDGLISGVTRDAASYKVTLIPSGTTLHVKYAFASEEYPEYVGSVYNDVMGIFVNGTNCALVPGTSLPVSVNNVNDHTNSAYYVDNSTGAAGYQTSFDGITAPLECTVPVSKGQQVTVEIAVADTGDGVLDSAVAVLDKGIFST